MFEEEYSPEYTYRTETLVINSADRDRSIYPNISSYTINLLSTINKNFQNVYSMRLMSAVFPDKQDITKQPYLILELPQFSGDLLNGTNSSLQKAFSIMQLDKPLVTDYFLNIKTDICRIVSQTFDPPIKINKLSINIKKTDGTLFNFGTDNLLPNSPTANLQHTLIFEIIYKIPKNIDSIRGY